MKNKILMQFLIIGLFIITITPLMAQITEIIAIDSMKYKIGDTINMGRPMDDGEIFVFAEENSESEGYISDKRNATRSQQSIVIIEITKFAMDYKVKCQRATGDRYLFFNYFIFNKAIETGEVVSKNTKYFVAPTSRQALNQLKKAKEKLDLGLITKEEYDKKLKTLKKYIEE